MSVKVGIYIYIYIYVCFCVYRRSYLLWSPVTGGKLTVVSGGVDVLFFLVYVAFHFFPSTNLIIYLTALSVQL